MKIGFNTGCFPDRTLDDIMDFAGKNNFSSIEVVCAPKGVDGIHHIDVEDINDETALHIKEKLGKKGLEISCLSYYSNPFMAPDDNRDYHKNYIFNLIDAAEKLGVDRISTFTGFLPEMTMEENIALLAEAFGPVLSKAARKNIKIMLENTPMMTGRELEGNFAYSPELWDMIFTKIPDENFGLNYDPSHLFWLGVDYMLFLNIFSDRIFHVQAKDAEIIVERLRMTGILGNNWFRYRIPGSGSIDWKKFLSSLYEAGYDDTVSIELEDPIWLDSTEKIEKGLLLGKKFLENYIV